MADEGKEKLASNAAALSPAATMSSGGGSGWGRKPPVGREREGVRARPLCTAVGYGRPWMKKEKIVVHDDLLAKVGVALRRAARRAGEIAAQTNTPIVVYENG